MNQLTQEQLDDAVLTLSGTPEWAIVMQGLQADIYHMQASVFDAPDWDTVNKLRGFAEGLAYVINLRNTVTGLKEIEEANRAPV